MATFSLPSYNSTHYASFRPTYPDTLYTDFLLPYHQGARSLLIDLGCGPGTVTRPLGSHFTRAIGTDPSPVMLESAAALTPPSEYPSISFRSASAENLDFLGDGEADMVVAGQASHWFDHGPWWKEMSRVVRSGGTVAVWCYRDWIFPKLPKASVVVREYSNNKDKMGSYWSQPGRSYVDDRLRVIRPPEGGWEEVLRWEYEPEFEVPASAEDAKIALLPILPDDGKPGFGRLVKTGDVLMQRRMKMREVEDYWRTWSCLHAWKLKHPEYVQRSEGGEGDIIDWAMDEIVEKEGLGKDWREFETDVVWGTGVIVARRK